MKHAMWKGFVARAEQRLAETRAELAGERDPDRRVILERIIRDDEDRLNGTSKLTGFRTLERAYAPKERALAA